MEPMQLNRCSLPPWVIATSHYNSQPKPLEIQGVRQSHAGLFERLDHIQCQELRSLQFHDWMDVAFQLHQWENQSTSSSSKSLKNSYLRILRGWMFDSNSIEGAVLKGWVESRIGLSPTYHRESISDRNTEAYYTYTVDQTKGMARTSAIYNQLDVLYEYCQYELAREGGTSLHQTLYRGVYDMDEQRIIEQVDKRHCLVQLNNLLSFTTDFERAWEFGTRVMKVEVPRYKIFFASHLFSLALLRGEEEVLVIGGQYYVDLLTGG